MSTYSPADQTAAEYARRADEAERSPVPVFLKIGRVIVWIVYAYVLVTAILLLLAFFLRLAGANPDASFVEWVYRSAAEAMEPFRGIFPTHEINDASVLDMSLLFATVAYFVVALLVDILLRWLTGRLQRQERETVELRSQADDAAQQAAAQRYASQQAVQEAAAREYAAQQAAAQQYAIAQAAAHEVVSQQQATGQPTQVVRSKPTPPAGPAGPIVDPIVDVEGAATDPPAG